MNVIICTKLGRWAGKSLQTLRFCTNDYVHIGVYKHYKGSLCVLYYYISLLVGYTVSIGRCIFALGGTGSAHRLDDPLKDAASSLRGVEEAATRNRRSWLPTLTALGALPEGVGTISAAVAADLVLIPVQPGPFDLWGSSETLKLLDTAEERRTDRSRRSVRRLFVLNRAHPTATLSRDAVRSLEGRVPVATVVVHQRIAFAEAAAIGESVLTTQPKGAAAEEIRRLYREVSK